MAQGIHSSTKPSLLTKTEIDWLSGKTHLSKSYEYKIKSIIKSKLKALSEFELPLILNSGLFPEAANLPIFKNRNEAISKTSSDYSNLSIKEDEEKLWAGFGDGELNSDTYGVLVRQRSRSKSRPMLFFVIKFQYGNKCLFSNGSLLILKTNNIEINYFKEQLLKI